MASRAVLGVDIGGTKIAAGVVTAEGQVRSYVQSPTPRHFDAEGLLAFAAELAKRAARESDQPPQAMGIGCGGPMNFPEGIVSPLHIPVWKDFSLRARLQGLLGLPAVLDNDAKAFALGEAIFGAGRGARCMLGMVVSTGVGGGIVVNGRLFDGASGNAGHVGHIIVSRGGPRCYCGGIGCVTVYASGTGLAARARSALTRMRNIDDGRWTNDHGLSSIVHRHAKRSALASIPLEEVTGRAIAEAAKADDPLAVRLMRDASLALAMAIASATNLLDLDRVVIGGGLAQSGELLFGPLRAELRRRARLDFSKDVEVLQASLGTESGVIGAASLALSTEPVVSG